MKKQSQNNRIISHLSKGRTLNPQQALKKFGCMRLAARVNELRVDYPINTKIKRTKEGVKFAEYSL
jgi:hypothetical protein